MSKNRLWNISNTAQGKDIKVLCVCSAGLLRSPTMARLLCRKYKNVNPRAVGHAADFALIPLENLHIAWADIILLSDSEAYQACIMVDEDKLLNYGKSVLICHVEDDYNFGDAELEEKLNIEFESFWAADPIFRQLIPFDSTQE